MINIAIKIAIFLITMVMGRIFWKRSSKKIAYEDKMVNNALKDSNYNEDDISEISEEKREEVLNKITRIESIMNIIKSDDRYDEDYFGDPDLGEGDREILVELIDGRIVISIESSSEELQNDMYNMSLFEGILRQRHEDLSIHIGYQVKSDDGREVNVKEYRNKSDIPESYSKKIILQINRGSDESIADLILVLASGVNTEEELSGGDGSYYVKVGEKSYKTHVILMDYFPIKFIV